MSRKRIVTYEEHAQAMGEIRNLKKTIQRQGNNQNPTVPLYDQLNFPQDPVPGQVALDPSDGSAWGYTDANGWKKMGGGIDFDTEPQSGNWLYVETTGVGPSIPVPAAVGGAHTIAGFAFQSTPGTPGTGMLLQVEQTGSDSADALDMYIVTADGDNIGIFLIDEATGNGNAFGQYIGVDADGSGDAQGVEADTTAHGNGISWALYGSAESDGSGEAVGVYGIAGAEATGKGTGGYFDAFSLNGDAIGIFAKATVGGAGLARAILCMNHLNHPIFEVHEDGSIHGLASIGAITWDLV